MNWFVWIPVAVVVIVILWYVATYNNLRRMKVFIQEAWSGIDVQLKRKANIIPNLVDTLKMQMKFEEGVLTKLTEARAGLTSSNRAEAMKANDEVTRLLPSINAVAEAYPELGTNKSFLQMMGDIRDCEDKVAFARNRYNIAVSRFNMEIATIPSNMVAGMMGLQAEQMFEIEDAARKDADNLRISNL